MALSTHALTTYDTVKAELGLKDDMAQDAIERLINAASEAMEKAAGGRHFEYKAGEVELHRGYGDHRLVLRRTPVTTLTQIRLLELDGSVVATYDAAGYTLEDAEAGFVFRSGSILGTDFPNQRGGWPWTAQAGQGIRSTLIAGTERASIEVTYDGGYITPEQEAQSVGARTLPYDLEQAVVSSVVSLFQSRNRDRQLTSKTTNQVSETWAGPENRIFGLLTAEASSVARAYWRGL